MEFNITCIPGDGIGPEIVSQAKIVLDKVAAKFNHRFNYKDILMGGASIDVHGIPRFYRVQSEATTIHLPGISLSLQSVRQQDF